MEGRENKQIKCFGCRPHTPECARYNGLCATNSTAYEKTRQRKENTSAVVYFCPQCCLQGWPVASASTPQQRSLELWVRRLEYPEEVGPVAVMRAEIPGDAPLSATTTTLLRRPRYQSVQGPCPQHREGYLETISRSRCCLSGEQ